jgi:hypothetical protein
VFSIHSLECLILIVKLDPSASQRVFGKVLATLLRREKDFSEKSISRAFSQYVPALLHSNPLTKKKFDWRNAARSSVGVQIRLRLFAREVATKVRTRLPEDILNLDESSFVYNGTVCFLFSIHFDFDKIFFQNTAGHRQVPNLPDTSRAKAAQIASRLFPFST